MVRLIFLPIFLFFNIYYVLVANIFFTIYVDVNLLALSKAFEKSTFRAIEKKTEERKKNKVKNEKRFELLL